MPELILPEGPIDPARGQTPILRVFSRDRPDEVIDAVNDALKAVGADWRFSYQGGDECIDYKME